MNKKQKEFDIERSEYDDKVEEIRKKKRKLRDIQEPSLVKKIKKDLLIGTLRYRFKEEM